MQIQLDKFETPQVAFPMREEEKQRVPQHYCKTCTKLKEHRCDVFERIVEPDYNRCFFHSDYSIIQKFRPLPQDVLDKIIEQEEAQQNQFEVIV